MIKCIIFDVYGTLISTGTGSVDAAAKILDGKNVDISAKNFYACWKKLHKQHMQCADCFINEEQIFLLDLKRLYEMFGIEGDYKTDIKPMLDSLYNRTAFDDTLSALNELSEKYELVIGSNTDTNPLLHNLGYNRIGIKKVYTSESLGAYKPDKSFFQKILDDLGYSAQECLYVGDSLTDDIFGAQQLGIPACLIDRKGNNSPCDIIPDFTITSLNQIKDLF